MYAGLDLYCEYADAAQSLKTAGEELDGLDDVSVRGVHLFYTLFVPYLYCTCNMLDSSLS